MGWGEYDFENFILLDTYMVVCVVIYFINYTYTLQKICCVSKHLKPEFFPSFFSGVVKWYRGMSTLFSLCLNMMCKKGILQKKKRLRQNKKWKATLIPEVGDFLFVSLTFCNQFVFLYAFFFVLEVGNFFAKKVFIILFKC